LLILCWRSFILITISKFCYSVLVHSGGVHGGHYYAFIRPSLSDQWYIFKYLFIFCGLCIYFLITCIVVLNDFGSTTCNLVWFISVFVAGCTFTIWWVRVIFLWHWVSTEWPRGYMCIIPYTKYQAVSLPVLICNFWLRNTW
jgi:hypothetical protein